MVNRKTTGEIITSHKYTLDAAGHRTKIEEVGSIVEYGYDKLNRLTSEKRNGVVTLDDGYTYDPVGNRLTKSSLGGNSSYTYDENDRLKSDGKYTYGWDENGNLTSRSGSDGTTTYRYDPENRLVEASGPNGVTQFAYDAQGNRISRTSASGTTTFVVDPNMPYAQVLEENGPAGAKVYAYGNDMLNMQGPEGTRWFAYDGLGSTRALTDNTGTLTDAYTYEAFGTVVHRTGTSANDFQFTGEQYEAALDMYYLRARYYEPGTGRFGARDPLASLLQGSSFRYCANNPANTVDPSGYVSLAELSTSMSVRAVLIRGFFGGLIGFGMGMVDALLGGADVREAVKQALWSGAIGAVGSALGPVRIIRNIFLLTGIQLGVSAVADSIEKGKGWQALFRVATLIAATWGLARSFRNIVRGNGETQVTPLSDEQYLEQLPVRQPGDKTSGILLYEEASERLISGRNGPAANLGRTPGMNAYTKTHVEGHAAAIMRQCGVQNAKLVINNAPCAGCEQNLAYMLPEGAQLTVIGPNGFVKVYVGLPD